MRRLCVLLLVLTSCAQEDRLHEMQREIRELTEQVHALDKYVRTLNKPAPANPSTEPPQEMPVEKLFGMVVTPDARGPEDIQRNLGPIKGKVFTVAGTVFDVSAKMRTIELKGAGQEPSYVQCQFAALPPKVKTGQPLKMRGTLAGYFMVVQMDNCTVVP